MNRRQFIKGTTCLLFCSTISEYAEAFCPVILDPLRPLTVVSLCTQPSGSTIIGGTTVTYNSYQGSGRICLSNYPAFFSCTITWIYAWMSELGSGDSVTFGIYSSAGSLLSDTTAIMGIDSTARWYKGGLDSGVTLTAGTTYWLAIGIKGTGANVFSTPLSGSSVQIQNLTGWSAGTLPLSINLSVTGITSNYALACYGKSGL